MGFNGIDAAKWSEIQYLKNVKFGHLYFGAFVWVLQAFWMRQMYIGT